MIDRERMSQLAEVQKPYNMYAIEKERIEKLLQQARDAGFEVIDIGNRHGKVRLKALGKSFGVHTPHEAATFHLSLKPARRTLP